MVSFKRSTKEHKYYTTLGYSNCDKKGNLVRVYYTPENTTPEAKEALLRIGSALSAIHCMLSPNLIGKPRLKKVTEALELLCVRSPDIGELIDIRIMLENCHPRE